MQGSVGRSVLLFMLVLVSVRGLHELVLPITTAPQPSNLSKNMPQNYHLLFSLPTTSVHSKAGNYAKTSRSSSIVLAYPCWLGLLFSSVQIPGGLLSSGNYKRRSSPCSIHGSLLTAMRATRSAVTQ